MENCDQAFAHASPDILELQFNLDFSLIDRAITFDFFVYSWKADFLVEIQFSLS